MYATIKGLLNKFKKKKEKETLPVLELETGKELADGFLSLFIAKVTKIKVNVGSNVTDFVDESSMFYSNQVTSMHNLNLLTPGYVEKIIKNFPSKICSLDSILIWLVKDNLHTLLPILTKVVNSSLTPGTFPDTLKQSIITPVLKKSSLDHNILKHFITQDACNHDVRALFLSCINYVNSLLFGARKADIKRLQRLQNKAARLVFACGRDRI